MPACFAFLRRGKIGQLDMETSEKALATQIASALQKEMIKRERERERERMAAKIKLALEVALRTEIRQLKSDMKSGSSTPNDGQHHRPRLATFHCEESFQERQTRLPWSKVDPDSLHEIVPSASRIQRGRPRFSSSDLENYEKLKPSDKMLRAAKGEPDEYSIILEIFRGHFIFQVRPRSLR